jgi:hypothetical protein
MIKMSFPSTSDLTKMITAAAEKQISEKARRAALPFGGVQVRFRHKSGGALDAVEFDGSEEAVQAARAAVAG